MHFNFELILFYAVLVAGLISLLDMLLLAPKRKQLHAELVKKSVLAPEVKMPLISDYARSFFPVLLLVFLLRSFLVEPFRIPSGSLEPSLMTGDFILVNKFNYGVRLPVLHKEIYPINKPQRGDIAIFRWPPNPSVDFIKRVVGLPGDHISYIDKELLINGNPVPQQVLKETFTYDQNGGRVQVLEKEEDLLGIKHKIFQDPPKQTANFQEITVPDGMYFMMGDNRDDSADSRYWGFVPEENLVGKAVLVWMSWDSIAHKIRWDRIIKGVG